MRISPSTLLSLPSSKDRRREKKTHFSYYSFLIKIKAPEKLILLAWLLVIFLFAYPQKALTPIGEGSLTDSLPSFLGCFSSVPFSLLSAINRTIGHDEVAIGRQGKGWKRKKKASVLPSLLDLHAIQFMKHFFGLCGSHFLRDRLPM